MNSRTLRGIFPNPKTVSQRDFIQENKQLIKEIVKKNRKFQEQPVKSKINHRPVSQTLAPTKIVRNQIRPATSLTPNVKEMKSFDKSVQTDSINLMPKLTKRSPKKPNIKKHPAAGDNAEQITENFKKIDLKEKTNTSRSKKQETNRQNDQKSNKNREIETQLDNDTNKSDFVLLPDDERQEYLRIARKNYAGLIEELNTMPVRTDTLRRRKRKIQIENELKRLDEVIKIFQKQKVFVKDN